MGPEEAAAAGSCSQRPPAPAARCPLLALRIANAVHLPSRFSNRDLCRVLLTGPRHADHTPCAEQGHSGHRRRPDY